MSRARRLPVDPPELNLVPLLDMVSLLIQLLLVNAQFGVFTELGSEIAGAPTDDPGKGLLLEVRISSDGYGVAWSEDGARRQQTVPCLGGACEAPDRYDAAGLSAVVEGLKAKFPSEEQVLLAPTPSVPFDVMIRTIDALRATFDQRALFPNVVVGDLADDAAGAERRR